MATRKTTTVDVPDQAPAGEPARIVLSWAADAPARAAARQRKGTSPDEPDTTQPTRDELAEGQQAAELGLAYVSEGLEDLASLCRTLGANVTTPAVDLAIALRVVAKHMDDIRLCLDEQSEAIVPLANLAAWYHRSADAQAVTR
jgi:hypothetical protein